MSLQMKYASKDELPDDLTIADLYEERDGALVFTGIANIKTDEDISRMRVGLEKEREDHRTTKSKLAKYANIDLEEMQRSIDRIPELEAAANASPEEIERKLQDLVEPKLRQRIAPIERERDQYAQTIKELTDQVSSLSLEKTQRIIHDSMRKAARDNKTRPEADPDILMLSDAVMMVTDDGEVVTKENAYGIPAGLTPDVLFGNDLKTLRPHFWPPNEGAGAGGSKTGGGVNPWKSNNLTDQTRYIQKHGMDKARQLAAAAGKKI